MENRFTLLARAFLETPPLWTHSQFGMEQFLIPEVVLSRLQPIPFASRMRLGHKIELVFLALLYAQNRYRLIEKNIEVKREKRTLGEIDFLLWDSAEDRAIHLELSYKFYLIDTDISEPIYRLVGPNRRDMFYTKLDKLRYGQFALPQTQEGKEVIKSFELDPGVLDKKVCFKAQLFKPFGSVRTGIRPLNSGCIAGSWMRFSDFENAYFKEGEFYFPTKEEWVLEPFDTTTWISYYETLLELNIRLIKKNSTLLWMRKASGIAIKFFVVWW